MYNYPTVRPRSTEMAKLIRKTCKADGIEVSISRDGHVLMRSKETGKWLEGRWVDEYVELKGRAVLR